MPKYSLRLIGLGSVFAVSLTLGSVLGSTASSKSDAARADAFWGTLHVNAIEAPVPTTLGELINDSDAVVIGRVIRVERGREWVAAVNLEPAALDMAGEAMARFATVTVAIETPLIGAKLGTSVALEVFLPTPGSLEELQAEIPQGRAMFFLHRKLDPGLDSVYRLVGDQASFFLDDGGRVRAPIEDGSALSAELANTVSFEALTDQVKAFGSAP